MDDLVNGLISVIHLRFLHRGFLFFGHRRIRIDSKHEGKENINEALYFGLTHFGPELLKQLPHKLQGPAIGCLKREMVGLEKEVSLPISFSVISLKLIVLYSRSQALMISSVPNTPSAPAP